MSPVMLRFFIKGVLAFVGSSLIVFSPVIAATKAHYAELLQQELQHAGDRAFDRALAHAALAAGDVEHAIFVLERLRLLYPNDMESRLDLIRLYLSRGDVQRAREILKEIPINTSPEPLRSYLVRLNKRLNKTVSDNHFLIMTSFGYDTNPGVAPAHRRIRLANGQVLYPEKVHPQAYLQYMLRAGLNMRRYSMDFSLMQRHYNAKFTQHTLFTVQNSYRFTPQWQGVLNAKIDVRDTYRHTLEIGASKRATLLNQRCMLDITGLFRWNKTDLYYLPGQEIELGGQAHCFQNKAHWRVSYTAGLKGVQVIEDDKTPLNTTIELSVGMGAAKPPYYFGLFGSIAHERDAKPWYPPLFGEKQRDLTTYKATGVLQYTLMKHMALGSVMQYRRYTSPIFLYDASDYDFSLYFQRKW